MPGEYGFTGTEKGMAPRQLKAFRRLLGPFALNVEKLHYGDCVGADAQAFEEAGKLGIWRISHPPSNSKARAFTEPEEERPVLPYLIRDQLIARDGVDGLIATPAEFIEVLRSGTWATIRYARKRRRRIWIIRPDGRILKENQ